MSEIKGQLLGVLLVLTVFGILSGVLISVFTSASARVETNVNGIVEDLETNPSSEPSQLIRSSSYINY